VRTQDPGKPPLRLMRIERGGQGKYTVIDNRTGHVVKNDEPGGDNEHFVIMLKDSYARAALLAYAQAAGEDGQTLYAEDVTTLANRAGPCHKLCKTPD
jgi:hypothetical protein